MGTIKSERFSKFRYYEAGKFSGLSTFNVFDGFDYFSRFSGFDGYDEFSEFGGFKGFNEFEGLVSDFVTHRLFFNQYLTITCSGRDECHQWSLCSTFYRCNFEGVSSLCEKKWNAWSAGSRVLFYGPAQLI